MHPNEKKLTAEQAALLQHITPLEATTVYHNLHLTLEHSMANTHDPNDPDAAPVPMVVDAWIGVLQLMHIVHKIAITKH
jgi:hypothetical protein